MTHGPLLRRTKDDAPNETIGGDRDPQIVTHYKLLAKTMPSVLARLRPIDSTSDGILRYFMNRDFQRKRLDAARCARS
jgi:hypothetical protein